MGDRMLLDFHKLSMKHLLLSLKRFWYKNQSSWVATKTTESKCFCKMEGTNKGNCSSEENTVRENKAWHPSCCRDREYLLNYHIAPGHQHCLGYNLFKDADKSRLWCFGVLNVSIGALMESSRAQFYFQNPWYFVARLASVEAARRVWWYDRRWLGAPSLDLKKNQWLY